MTDHILEIIAQCPFTSSYTGGVEVTSFLSTARFFFGQKHVSIGTVRRNFQGFPGQPDSFLRRMGFPRFVHQLLRFFQRGLRSK